MITFQEYLNEQVDVAESNAISKYTKASGAINDDLHKVHAGKPMPKRTKTIAEKISSALNKNKSEKDMHVYTGLRESPAKHFKDHTKAVKVHLPAFTSTTLKEKESHRFAVHSEHDNDSKHGIKGKAKHILKIHVPKGTAASNIKEHSHYPHEDEVLIDRGHNIEIHPKPEKVAKDIYMWHAKILDQRKKKL